MDIASFFLKWKDKFCDFDRVFQNQCVDIVKQYFKDVLNKEPFKGNAIDYWTIPGWTKFENKGLQWPKPGDLIIWAEPKPYGHIAVCNWSRTFDLGVFEQNYPLGNPCHYRQTNYKGILGWLRPNLRYIEWPVAFIGSILPDSGVFLQKVMEYTSGKIRPVIKPFNNQIQVSQAIPSYDICKPFLDTITLSRCKSAFIFYPNNPTSTFEVAHLYPEKNLSFATVPLPQLNTVLVHAFLHLLRKYINFNHLAYIEEKELYPSSWSNAGDFNDEGWRFHEQYQEIVNALKL